MNRLRIAGTQEQHAVCVRAPGKVNLALLVGSQGADGYHPLVSVFQAVSLYEEVVAAPGSGVSLSVRGAGADQVPRDETNLAWRAALLLADHVGLEPDVALSIDKGVPVAGGMAGGSADAAAALVACDALWGTALGRGELLELAAELGSDVPFCLVGHTAVGTGRGHVLSPVMTRGRQFWAFGMQSAGLSTARAFAAFDEDNAEGGTWWRAFGHEPPTAMMAALRAGDAHALGPALCNDLEATAVAAQPVLVDALRVARRAGALGAIVSGSGPTVAALGRSQQHATAIAAALTAAGVVDTVACAVGGVAGARVVPG
ncbi:MAG: 4-(cytidine 5'-diphospho)-2-C-methyl-D-erythritol kinase [Cellulomonadaceae bacterium]